MAGQFVDRLMSQRRMLLQFEGEADFDTLTGERSTPVRSEAYMLVTEEGGLLLRMDRFETVCPGLTAGPGGRPTGKLSISGLAAETRLQLHGNGARLEIGLQALVYYGAIGRELGYIEQGQTLYPRFEQFGGRLVAQLELEGGNILLSGRASFDYESGGLGWIRHVAVTLPRVLLLPFAPGPAPPGCPEERWRVRRKLKIRPVGFASFEDDPDHTGKVLDKQIRDARAVWGKCCVELELLDLVVHVDPARKISGDPEFVAGAPDDLDPNVVEWLFVTDPLTGHNGARTVPIGTSASKVVMTEENKRIDNLLAHELGHVLRGDHPNTNVQPPFWAGDPGTVLRPISNQFPIIPSKNTLFNCLRADSPLIISSPREGCCLRPDGP